MGFVEIWMIEVYRYDGLNDFKLSSPIGIDSAKTISSFTRKPRGKDLRANVPNAKGRIGCSSYENLKWSKLATIE